MAEGRLANWDIASLFVAAAFGVIAAHLTYLVATVDSEFITAVLFRPMWIGLYGAYLMTGQEQATARQDEIAPFLAAVINALVYAAGVLAIRLILRQLLLPDTTNPQQSTKRI